MRSQLFKTYYYRIFCFVLLRFHCVTTRHRQKSAIQTKYINSSLKYVRFKNIAPPWGVLLSKPVNGLRKCSTHIHIRTDKHTHIHAYVHMHVFCIYIFPFFFFFCCLMINSDPSLAAQHSSMHILTISSISNVSK